ncbi:MAG: hypothetical protein WAW42_02515 [Candidatus Competibacteraceae bacterium]
MLRELQTGVENVEGVVRQTIAVLRWIRLGIAAALILAGALYVLIHDGVSGLFSAILVVLFVFSALSRESGREDRGAGWVSWDGEPSEDDKMYDPAYRGIHPNNIYNWKK